MSLADLAKSEPPAIRKGPSCSVCRTLGRLPAPEADALNALMADTRWTYKNLSRALEGNGITLPPHRLAYHARGECTTTQTGPLRS